MSEATPSHLTVRAVDRALEILLCFSRTADELSLSEIAKQVGLHKSTAHRLLMSLQHKGFVRRHPHSEKYILGWSILELLNHVYPADDLATLALPEMTHLRDITGETINLFIRSGTDRIRIQAVESLEPIRNVVTIGTSVPLYAGAAGKVLLAYAEEHVLAEILNDQSFPPELQREELLSQLDKIRQDGFAISIRERDVGAAALAVPIFDLHNHCTAALSVSGPASRFTMKKMSEHIETLQRSALWMSQLLSH